MSKGKEYKALVERANAVGLNVYFLVTHDSLPELATRYEHGVLATGEAGTSDLAVALDDLALVVEVSERARFLP